jgi:hypothetical protein
MPRTACGKAKNGMTFCRCLRGRLPKNGQKRPSATFNRILFRLGPAPPREMMPGMAEARGVLLFSPRD